MAIKKEAYERKIAKLETEIEGLKQQLEDSGLRAAKERQHHLKTKEQFYAGLTQFLTNLHGDLSKAQGQILRNLQHLNSEVLSHNDERIRAAREMLLASLPSTELLGATSGDGYDD